MTPERPRRVLTIAAHPDDEILGCGATMAAHAARGDSVSILILGEGLTSRAQTRAAADRAGIPGLQRDAHRAAAAIGVSDVTLLDFPDNRFDSVPLLDVVKAVEQARDRVRPDVVYVHHWGDLNIDHRVTFDAVMAAFRPLPEATQAAVYAYEVPSSTGWAGPSPAMAFLPNHYVSIGPALDRKIEAMELYESERRTWPHPRAPDALRAWARYRGTQVGVDAAEAFVTVRTVVTG
ncbi:MAG: PIG-L deacetylase family protein [Vicinamibacterales bacterium]